MNNTRQARSERVRREVQRCSSCHAPVRWETTVRGKPIPLDPTPVPGAHLFIRADGLVADDRSHPPPEGAARYETHFATCPNASEHRRRT